MRHIKKGKEPKILTEYKSTPNATYMGFGSKDIVRKALIKEQKGICAYCNGRISAEYDIVLKKYKTDIEHYKSRELYPHLQLEYSNMLGVCTGNESDDSGIRHCDKNRPEKSELSINPFHKNIETYVKYSSLGVIYSENLEYNIDLNDILNLNFKRLKDNRKRVYDIVVQRMKQYFPKKKNESWLISEVKSEIKYWEELDEAGNLKPFCQVAISYLQNKLRRM
jgi:uncharacterized protein (TIGR02646 family)